VRNLKIGLIRAETNPARHHCGGIQALSSQQLENPKARSIEMVRMLLWQFTRPVLWANLLAGGSS
jgi:hypothetical protein